MLIEVEYVLAFLQIFKFDPGNSIKLLPRKIEKMFLLSMVRFNPGRAYYHLCQFKTYQLMQLRQFHRLNIC